MKPNYLQRVLFTFIFFFSFFLVNFKSVQANGGGNIYIEPSVTLIDQNIKVSPGSYVTYTLDSITPSAKVGIKISVTGGINNDIFAYLLDKQNHARFKRKQGFSTYLENSKIINQNFFQLRLPHLGPYYLVLDNTNSIVSSKNVRVYVISILSEPLDHHIALKKKLEEFYGILNESLDFPGFDIYVRHCGEENAYSNPDITICIELMEGAYKRGNEIYIGWTILHELGHTLLRLWNYPLWDNEDAADEFATAFILMAEKNNEARITLRQVVNEWMSKPSDIEAEEILKRSNRHSISIQRARNILEWIQNSDELKRRWFNKIFLPHVKTGILKQMEMKPEPYMDIYLIENELKRRNEN